MSLKSNSFVAGQNKYVFSLFLNTDNDETTVDDSRELFGVSAVQYQVGCGVCDVVERTSSRRISSVISLKSSTNSCTWPHKFQRKKLC